MSCLNSTSPIDITNNSAGNCELKCKYRYKYNESTSTITNKGDYLSLSYEKPNIDPVIYNSNPYYVEEVRIYQPSLHKYSGSNTDAELIIIHRSDYSGKLLVCIPITSSEKDTSEIDNIIVLASKYTSKKNKITYSTKPINLNRLIPSKPMYVYKGTLPFDTCDGEHNIIAFNKLNDAYIPLSRRLLNELKKIITNHTITIKENTFYINKNGPMSSLIDNSGDIYIDCKPTNEDGNIIGDDQNESNANETPPLLELFSTNRIKSFINSPFFQIFAMFIFSFLIYKLFLLILELIGNKFSLGGVKSSNT